MSKMKTDWDKDLGRFIDNHPKPPQFPDISERGIKKTNTHPNKNSVIRKRSFNRKRISH